MRTRISLLVLLLSAIPAFAKPPGLPLPPLVDGTEPPPVVREFHQCDRPPYSDPASFWAAVERVRTMLCFGWK